MIKNSLYSAGARFVSVKKLISSRNILYVRNIKQSDSIQLLRWRNDVQTRFMSLDTRIVGRHDHNAWFKNATNSDNMKIYIGCVKGVRAGVCRFYSENDESKIEISISLDNKFRGRSLAAPMLMKSIKLYRSTNPINFQATVKKGNNSSIRLFKMCGFRIVQNDGYVIKFERIYY